MPRGYLDDLLAELALHGVTDYQVRQGRKHGKLTFLWRGKRQTLVYALSPSDGQRGLLNALSTLRRLMGVRKQSRKSERPRRRSEGRPERLGEPPRITNPVKGMEQLEELLRNEE